MDDLDRNVVQAVANLERAKASFFHTLGKIEHRFSPAELVAHTGDAIGAKLRAVGRSGIEQAKKRPLVTAAGAAAAAAFLARRLISRAIKPATSSAA